MKKTSIIILVLVILVVVFYIAGNSGKQSDVVSDLDEEKQGTENTGNAEESSPLTTGTDEEAVINKVKEVAVSGREGLASVDDAKFISIERNSWPDACLGIETEVDEVCAQVVTEGYRVVLRLGGAEFVYHTDITGDSIRFKESISLEE
ncbi:hypothetical protein COV42_01000 [Candidatus Campbellbacteria bacterium CG11_big_fil_rev_8_21_14_0_20_44_21]|uniref:Uncharacterized protein n=1 Tax=Candidatus Campbellbacteria bacterium CG22_combo_CG10-13_8_21_14_all_43_18 TaxID=1974530 RepID=A0A2H0DYL5_9BACT|nr:MAG: hypothetical protein COW82_00220 [Candidatus Campbellbacteria bacterium CG22_combo_CG10-13_8_21_14_all_43_18]PIR24372.1 MAG: hypothetical protein COV42_01000 [Candidatus Campbellbacteria bacterium CG11_big_fil_rev_8_21_14_0_20_44_21]